MDSTFNYSIRRLPNGDALLCDGSGAPIACNSQGKILVNSDGVPMTVDQAKASGRFSSEKKVEKVPLDEYRTRLSILLNPRLNLRSMQIECNGEPITEEEFENLNVRLVEDQGLHFKKGDLQSTVRAHARKAEYDPVKEWLDGLGSVREGVLTDDEWSRIAQLMLGVGDAWSQTVLQKWLLSAASRVVSPGCKVDYALMLYGKQGIGKSSLFRELAGDHFTDSMGALDNIKDDLMIMHKAWIAEWSEADQVFVGANKAERIKRFVSAQDDSFRAPYGRNTQTFKRRSVIVGTTNRDDWANDPTGNRRFPILRPQSIDTEWIRENRERIWGRVMVELRRGAQWWFTKEEEATISQQAQEFAPLNPIVEEVWEFLQVRQGEEFSVRELWGMALGRDQEQLSDQILRQTSRVLRQLEARGASFKRKNHLPREASYGKRSKSLVISYLRQ